MRLPDLKLIAALTLAVGATSCRSGLSAAPENAAVARVLRFNANITELPTVTSYTVHGRTFAELRESLRNEAVASGNGGRAVGLHTYFVSYKFARAIATQTGCSPDVRITVQSTTVLPKWAEEATADSSLRAAWRDFMDQLSRHEMGHRVLAVKEVDDMHRRMTSVQRPSCNDAYTEANRVFTDRFGKLRLSQQQYDADPANRVVFRMRAPAGRGGGPPPPEDP